MNIEPTPESLLLQAINDLLDAAPAPVRRRTGRGGFGHLENLTVSADTRTAAARDHMYRCVCHLRFSQDNPPRLSARGSCWFAMPGANICEHVLELLRDIREEIIRGSPRSAVQAMAKLMTPPTPEQLLARLDLAIEAHRPRALSADQWLAWRIALEDGRLTVLPLLRSLLKSGRPSKGRQVARNSGTDLSPYARLSQDLAVISLAEQEGARMLGSTSGVHSYPVAQISPPRVLALLAGHPEVEWADGLPVAIEEGTPGLGVREHEGRYELCLAFSGHTTHDASDRYLWNDGAAAWWPDERRLRVGPWKTATAAAVRDVLEMKVRVPQALGAALVQKLAPLRKTVSLTLPDSLRGRQVTPDCRPLLVCEPTQPSGASVRIEVRPLANGQGYPPGEGDRELSAFVGDERLSTVRDLVTEREAARRVIEGLSLPSEAGAPWEAFLVTDEEALELVARLQHPRWAELQVEWPARPHLLSQPVRAMRVQIEAQQDWFGVSGAEEIDGIEILLDDVLRAVRTGRRFVSVGQGKFVAIEQAFRERLERMGDVVHEARSGLQLSAVALPLADKAFEGVEIVAPLEWKKLIHRARRAREAVPQLPAGFEATLRDYQLDGFRWLWRLAEMGVGGCLADDMGLGKTVQAIAMLAHRAPEGPQLVVAPTSVGFNWQRELNRFARGLRVHDFREVDREKVVKSVGAGDVVVASYGLLRVSQEPLQQITWKTLVLDEAQAFKNYETDTARAVRSLKADWRVALTGTPMENHLGELYSLMHTVCPGLLGTWQQFLSSFGRPIEKEHDAGRREALARLLRPFILRRTKGQVLRELPPRTEIRLDATLSRQERTLYETHRLATLAQLEHRDDKADPRFIILAALTRLRQLASHARMVEPSAPKISAKQAVLREELDEVLEEGHTALVFSQFTSQLRLIEEELRARDVKTLYLDGGTPAQERRRLVDAFQRGEAPVFLVSLKAGGSGLNLTAADYVFLMDPWWNPAVEDQAADRAHRIGQQRPVTIVRIVAAGTVEENVLSLHASKRQLVASVLDGADVASTLTSDEMVDLLRQGQAESGRRVNTRPGSPAAAV